MSSEIRVEEQTAQAQHTETVVVLVHPDPGTYYFTTDHATDAHDTSAEVILDDILRKYDGAWRRLARM